MNHIDPTKRHEFVLLFDVKNGNPNGDPDAGNLPRVDPNNMKGIVTDVCIKRKIRDYVANVLGRPIFIQSEIALNTLIDKAAKDSGIEPAQVNIQSKEELLEWLSEQTLEEYNLELNENILRFTGEKLDVKFLTRSLLEKTEKEEIKKLIPGLVKELDKAAKGKKITPEKRKEMKERLIDERFDIRMFGAVLSTGLNAGQVRGPLQITFSESIDPIMPLSPTITRIAITKEDDKARKQTEMARKPYVPYGLYRTHGFYNPFLAYRNGNGNKECFVKEQDLKDLWEALANMFDYDHSASRGEVNARGLWVFTHEDAKGNAPSHKLFELVSVIPYGKPVSCFQDYDGKIISPCDGLIPKYPGVTIKRLV